MLLLMCMWLLRSFVQTKPLMASTLGLKSDDVLPGGVLSLQCRSLTKCTEHSLIFAISRLTPDHGLLICMITCIHQNESVPQNPSDHLMGCACWQGDEDESSSSAASSSQSEGFASAQPGFFDAAQVCLTALRLPTLCLCTFYLAFPALPNSAFLRSAFVYSAFRCHCSSPFTSLCSARTCTSMLPSLFLHMPFSTLSNTSERQHQ